MNASSITLFATDFPRVNQAFKEAKAVGKQLKKPTVVKLSRTADKLETGISITGGKKELNYLPQYGEDKERIQLNNMEEDFNRIAQSFIEEISLTIKDGNPDHAMRCLANSFLRASKDLTKKFIRAAIEEIPNSELSSLIEEISINKKPEEIHQKVIEEKPKYPGPHEDALEWLKSVWGDYLKFFGADEDYIYQDQLAKLDPRLMCALRNHSKYKNRLEKGGLKLSNIIPTKKDRITKEINSIDKDMREKIRKIEWVIQKRI